MIDKQNINRFRDWVNSNDWTLFEYTDKSTGTGNKNQWNCICSAMDWIDVSVQYIITHPLKSIRGDKSIELFAYIACVDIVVEAVEQLHRVIHATSKQVFGNDRKCFVDNPFDQTDREYFKTIRSCFGAHPVNLDDPEEPNNQDKKRFASWSGGYAGPGDFNVILYSNRVDGKDIILGIQFDQIEAFLNKYYDYLIELQQDLQKQYETFCEEKKQEEIPYDADPIIQLTILQRESIARLNNEYYRSTIEELLRMYQTPITCAKNRALVVWYRKALREKIDELHRNLQNMEFCDLSTDRVSYENLPLQNGWAYWLEKLNQVREGFGYPESLWRGRIQEIFDGYFEFEFESAQELYVLVCATLYKLSSGNQRAQ